MDSLWMDLRFALRSLRRSPGFSMAALATLALGIGATTALFSVVDGVLLRPAPFEAAHELVVVWETDRNSGTSREPASLPDFLDFQERSRTLASLAAVLPREASLVGPEGEPARRAALAVTHEYFALVGVQPVLGRTFTPGEDLPGAAPVALLAEAAWERDFGRDPAVVGRSIRLDEQPHTVVGVVPDAADWGALQVLAAADYGPMARAPGARVDFEVWTPLARDPETLPRQTHPLFLLGRLAPGATGATAQEELAAIAADLEAAHPVNEARGVNVQPLAEVVLGPARPALLVLLGAVGLVLLIACANVANLLLARGMARGREVAVRTALGAGAGRLARQFLVESLALTGLAALLGMGVAAVGLELLLALAPADVSRIGEVALDGRALGAALLLALLVGTVFGVLPSGQARRVALHSALTADGGRGATGGRERARLRSALIVAETALAVMLLVGAGLLIRSFRSLLAVDPGFRTEGVVKAEVQLPPTRYPADFSRWPDFREMHDFNARLLERLRAVPGVEAAAVAGNHPLDPGATNSFSIVGREAEAADWPEISIRRVSPGYFDVFATAVLAGRRFDDRDGTAATRVAVINHAAAERFFPGGDPLGRQISFWGEARTIVGVVANEKFQGLGGGDPVAVYTPLAQTPSATGAEAVVVRARGDAAAAAGALRAAIHEVDPALAVFGVEPLDDTLSRSLGDRRFATLLLGLFAGLALLLALVGVHGVLSYSVAQRTREIGIRVALGASAHAVVGQVVRQGMRPVLLGLVLGLAGALALSRVLATLLFGVRPTDPVTFLAAGAALIAVASVSAWLPARRAAHVDPVVALRVE